MKEDNRSRKQRINELAELRQKVAELEKKEAQYNQEITTLQESRRLYRSLFEDNPNAIVIVDSEARITGFNQARTKLEGKLPQIGQIMYKEYAIKHVTDMYAELQECITSGISKEFHDQLYDGRYLHIKMSPFSDGAIITAMDVTEHKLAVEALKESEATLKSILTAAPIGISLVHDGVFSWVSDEMNRMLGYTGAELIGKSTRVLCESKKECVRAGQPECRDINEKGAREIATRWLRKDGAVIDVLLRSTLVDPLDSNAGVTFTALDITARKRMEENLQRARKLESIGMLAGGIAHDFNNLLTSIIGSISLAKLDLHHEDEICDTLTIAEDASVQAKKLTQQLLTFSRGGAPIKTSLSIPELVEDATDFALRGSNVKCKYHFSDKLWLVEGDSGQLSQVFHNLSINADQAMAEGGIITLRAVNIHVDTKDLPTLKKENYVKVIFEDQGIGIEKDNLPKIFDPFFSTKPNGSGLGLASAYGIIKNHAGIITVESIPGKSTTFSIYLPASSQYAPNPKKETGNRVKGKNKILVMDDEENVRIIINKMLIYLGYEVELVSDGAEAIESYKQAAVSEKPFDVIIMDLTIPGGMGGKETLGEILAINPDAKVIVSSGYADDPIMADFKSYGFKDVAPKPYNVQELSKVLSEVLKQA